MVSNCNEFVRSFFRKDQIGLFVGVILYIIVMSAMYNLDAALWLLIVTLSGISLGYSLADLFLWVLRKVELDFPWMLLSLIAITSVTYYAGERTYMPFIIIFAFVFFITALYATLKKK